MTRPLSAFLSLILVLLLAGGCAKPDPDRPVEVAVINDLPALLASATAQGLVRHDGAGQVEPGLAIRWAISPDGLFYTFRLAPAEGLDARRVARLLRAAVADRREARIRPLLGAVREIVAVTPEVVEIRLAAPRPHLLDLLAQPELAIRGAKGGTGPLRLVEDKGNRLLLAPRAADTGPPDAGDGAAAEGGDLLAMPASRDQVAVYSERASVAILAFLDGRRDLVLGGRFAELPLARVAQVRPRDLRFDPANGLFGLRFEARTGMLAMPAVRRALAMSVDRTALVAAFGRVDWPESETILPAATLEITRPTTPGWVGLPLEVRRDSAIATLERWRRANPSQKPMPPLRIALPKGPGATLLFRRLAADWQPLGITIERVAPDAPADLRLVDEVAPSQSASWYLRQFECARSRVCSEVADAALDAARLEPATAVRAAQLAEADARLAEATPFIPLAQPLRWSLVSGRAKGFQPNIRAVHPLNHLLQAADRD